MKKEYKRKWIICCIVVILVCFCGLEYHYQQMQALRFVRGMGAGVNLGNTLDTKGVREYQPDIDELEFETAWGNPKIDEDTFAAIAEAGFGTVRIPVTWMDHLDEEYQISEKWLDRVQEVVDMALDQGLYVILDTHHEEWLDLQVEREAEITEEFRTVWQQIAVRFCDYDEHLLFEAMNEPRLFGSEYEWTAGTSELQEIVNRLNTTFIETVRKSGGKNEKRYLLIPPYGSSSEVEAMSALTITDKRIIVSVHMYTPYEFCQKEDGSVVWDTENNDVRNRIADAFAAMNTLFVKKHIPVILTEFGCKDRDNLEERVSWTEYYMQQAGENDIACIWWDCEEFHLLNRETKTWDFPEIVEVLTGKSLFAHL